MSDKKVIYKVVVEIDGVDHVHMQCDYSENVKNAEITFGLDSSNAWEVVEYVVDDWESS